MISVVSVPHTGSRFVLTLFTGERKLYHIGQEYGPKPWIIPLRHPHAVGESWKGRDIAGGTLKGGRRKTIGLLAEMFGQLPEGLYLPVDSTNRQQFLDRINAELGTHIETDWKYREPSGPRATLTDVERAQLTGAVSLYNRIVNG